LNGAPPQPDTLVSPRVSTPPETFRVGIDENGLGPRLGPLVVTAVVARCTDLPDAKGRTVADRKARGGMRTRLADSKKLVSHGDTSLGEAWARALSRRMGHPPPAAPRDLVRTLSLDTEDVLRAPCPSDHAAQCWSVGDEAFEAEAKLVSQIDRDLAKLEAMGVDVVSVACVVTCTLRLNEGVARGLTRFHMDLHAMERLALHARERAGQDVIATCGKVGGFDRYPSAFGPMNGWLHAVASEGRARSEYVIPELGRIAFVRDADDHHLLVSMASLVGKWVRDLLMARIVRYHRATQPDLPNASGYHDPVTTRFVKATRLTRTRQKLPDDCFERKAWGAETKA
jgi:ribonuclease HII